MPPAPRLGTAIRSAASDLYYNSVRLVPANALWALVLISLSFVVVRAPLLAPLLLLMVPLTMGLMGMATTLVRHGRVFWSDFLDSLRGRFWPLLGIGAGQLVIVTIAIADVFIALGSPGMLGPILLVGALYALAAVWVLSVTTWPLLLDPARSSDRIADILRLGAVLVLAHPVRMAGVALLIGGLLLVSTVLAAALVTVSGALAMLIAARYVLPAADRLEGRETLELD